MISFIDWTEGKLSQYVFEKKGSQITLSETLSVPLDGELNQSSLDSLVKADIEHVYLSVPVHLLTLRELSFPFSDKNKIKDTISYELEGILLGDVGNYSIDYIVKESSEHGSNVLAACMEKEKIRDIVALFLSAGLEPVAITCIDLRLFGKDINILFENPPLEEETRTEAAREELTHVSINLRQDELAYKGAIERIKKSLRMTGVLIVLLLLILGADMIVKLISLKKENGTVTQEINTLYRNTFPGEVKIIDAVRQFKGNLNSLMEKKKILVGMPVLDILLNISKHKKNNITLNELKLDEQNIIIKGDALSFENVDELKNAHLLSFKDVRVIDSRASPDKKITFSIIMREKRHEI